MGKRFGRADGRGRHRCCSYRCATKATGGVVGARIRPDAVERRVLPLVGGRAFDLFPPGRKPSMGVATSLLCDLPHSFTDTSIRSL